VGCSWTPGPAEYNDFTVTANQFFQRANSLQGGTLNLKRDLTLHNNAYFINGSVKVGRNFSVQGHTAGDVSISMIGSGTISSGGFRLPGVALTINTLGTLTLGSNLRLTSTGQDLLVQAGSLLQGNWNITVADQMIIAANATVDMEQNDLQVDNSLEIAGTLIRGPAGACGLVTAGNVIVSGAGRIMPTSCD
jgi:hypothetical protein